MTKRNKSVQTGQIAGAVSRNQHSSQLGHAPASLCFTPGCTNKRRPHARDCNTCHSRKVTKNNPLRRLFRNLKSHAKARGIEFGLTFEQFKSFAIETDYIRRRGQKSTSFVIDRIDPGKGYVIDNIQVLTNSANTVKNVTLERSYDYVARKMNWRHHKHYISPNDPLVPF